MSQRPEPTATAAIATPETDARLRREYNGKGADAFRNGRLRVFSGDPNSMIGGWFFEGYDRAARVVREMTPGQALYNILSRSHKMEPWEEVSTFIRISVFEKEANRLLQLLADFDLAQQLKDALGGGAFATDT